MSLDSCPDAASVVSAAVVSSGVLSSSVSSLAFSNVVFTTTGSRDIRYSRSLISRIRRFEEYPASSSCFAFVSPGFSANKCFKNSAFVNVIPYSAAILCVSASGSTS